MREFILGGARSGKSALAERLAAESGLAVTYIATAGGSDAELARRIERHAARRPAHWALVEEPLALGAALRTHAQPGQVVLVDCLTVWLANLLFADGIEFPDAGPIVPPPAFTRQREDFLLALQEVRGEVILVSNEVGMGIVPQGAISRWFVDEAGRLNQAVAAQCERVQWVAAGLPLSLKDLPC